MNPVAQLAGPLPHLPPADQPADGQRDGRSEMAEGDPHLQEQVSAQEQGASSFLQRLVRALVCIVTPPRPLRHSQESATMGGGIPICRQAQTKLEVCLYMFLWSPDTEAVLVAMSCFRHLCEEADIRSAADEVPVQSILPNYATFSELASVSNMMGTGKVLPVVLFQRHCGSPENVPAWQ